MILMPLGSNWTVGATVPQRDGVACMGLDEDLHRVAWTGGGLEGR